MYRYIILLFFLGAINLKAEDSILKKYIKTGLENNLALKQQDISIQKSTIALKEAKGMFYPSLSLNARYSRAGGGRTIDFPVGDMLNPVYSTLNAYLQQNAFPQIENEKINFLREEEHETKLSLTQAVYHPALFNNKDIKSKSIDLAKESKLMFSRELVAEIKTSYYRYKQASLIIQAYDNTEKVILENIRVCESLIKNGKSTKEILYRARAELAGLKQKKTDAEKNQKMAGNYLNFLLNRNLDEKIEVSSEDNIAEIELNVNELSSKAVENSNALNQLEIAEEINNDVVSLNKSAYLPNITFVLDYGFQGEKYSFGADDDYWMGSLVMQWNIFKGFQDNYKVQQAELENEITRVQYTETKEKIRLQLVNAVEDIKSAKAMIEYAEEDFLSSRESFNIIEKKFRQGMAPHIEYNDARNKMTNAEIRLISAKIDYMIKYTELEKAAGLYPIN